MVRFEPGSLNTVVGHYTTRPTRSKLVGNQLSRTLTRLWVFDDSCQSALKVADPAGSTAWVSAQRGRAQGLETLQSGGDHWRKTGGTTGCQFTQNAGRKVENSRQYSHTPCTTTTSLSSAFYGGRKCGVTHICCWPPWCCALHCCSTSCAAINQYLLSSKSTACCCCRWMGQTDRWTDRFTVAFHRYCSACYAGCTNKCISSSRLRYTSL